MSLKVSEFSELIFNNLSRMKAEEMEEVEELLDSMEAEIESATSKQAVVMSLCKKKKREAEMALRDYMQEFDPEVEIFSLWAKHRGIKEQKFLERWGIN